MKYLRITTIIILLFLVSVKVYASTTSSIHTTIQISVCGNNVAEGGEDCDNADLKGKSCTSLGYINGTLGCDISCSYNTTNCVVGTPTPTPNPTLSPTPQPTVTPVPNVTNAPTPTQQAPTNTPAPTPTIATTAQDTFPPILKAFVNENGTITVTELHSVLTLWVEGWKNFIQPGKDVSNKTLIAKNSCDVNRDGVCNLADLSVLLFHVTQ